MPLSSRSRLAAPSAGLEMFEFLLMFDRAAGSPKVHYFMIDPWAPSRLFPKMNTINFNKVGLIVCEGDSVCVCVWGGGGGGREGEGSGGGAAPRCTTL